MCGSLVSDGLGGTTIMNGMIKRLGGRLSVTLVTVMLLSIIAPLHASDKIANGSIVVSSITDSVGSININVGKGEGMKVGTKGVILQNGKQIAEYEVVQVNWGFSRIAVSNLAEGYKVQPGDSAPITNTADKSSSVKKKSPKSKLIWAVVGLAVAAVLLKGHKSSGGDSAGDSTITLTAQKTSSQNGSSTVTVTITANVKDQNGFAVADGTEVTFSTTAGTLNRASATTSAGRATVVLTKDATEDADSATVTAKVKEQTAIITVSFISSITLEVDPDKIQVLDSGGAQTESTITATCRDAAGNLATSGEVTFSTNIGILADDRVTMSGGIATTTFTCRGKGKADITATWSKSTATKTITVTAGPPYSMTVTSSPQSVPSGGSSYSTITATVKDPGGNLVTDGTKVHFSTDHGTILPEQVSTFNGMATARAYSSTSGTATIRVEVRTSDQPSDVPAPATDIVNQNATVQFISSTVGEIQLAANPTNIRGWDVTTGETTLTAIVYNTDHNPVPDGTSVHFTATHGIVGDNGTKTTSNGIATIMLQSDASGDGWDGFVDVTATAGGVTVTRDNLVIFSGPPLLGNCDASLSQTTLPKLNGQATISVVAHDLNDNPIADGVAVAVTTDKGTITAVGSATTMGGNAVFTLATSTDTDNPTVLGPGTVTVSVPHGNGGAPVVFTLPFTVTN
jgi:hypothetical protein